MFYQNLMFPNISFRSAGMRGVTKRHGILPSDWFELFLLLKCHQRGPAWLMSPRFTLQSNVSPRLPAEFLENLQLWGLYIFKWFDWQSVSNSTCLDFIVMIHTDIFVSDSWLASSIQKKNIKCNFLWTVHNKQSSDLFLYPFSWLLFDKS